MNRRLGALALLLTPALAFTLPAQPALAAAGDMQVEGQTFNAHAKLGDADLQLNGVGLRAVAWLKAYAAGLYLPRRTRAAHEALEMPGAKRVQLRLLLEASSNEFVKALDRGVAKNTTEAEFSALRERLATLTKAVASVGKVRRGDVINLDYNPGRGLQFSHNGNALGGLIVGEDLYTAVLKIFIGDKPIDPEMKAGLLGGPAA